MKDNNAHIEHRILAPAEESLRKIVQIIIPLDRSGSMAPKRKEIFSAMHELLNTLADENLVNVDVEYRVRLATFNDQITELTDRCALPPEDVAAMFGEDDYVCSGFTALAAVLDYLDKNLSRSPGSFLDGLRPGDCMPIILMPTDLEETDAPEVISAARERLMKNRFFNACKKIIIFVGSSESKKKAAAVLAGGEENVISITSNLKEFLAPVMISATMIQSDSTHISNRTTSPEKTGTELRKKTESGKDSQNRFRDKELEKELEDFLNGKNTMTDEELEKAMEKYLAG